MVLSSILDGLQSSKSETSEVRNDKSRIFTTILLNNVSRLSKNKSSRVRENVGLSVPRFTMSVGANECISNGRGVRVDKSILLPHFWSGECPNTFPLSHGPRPKFSSNSS